MSELRGPVQASERIQTLDIVRGFALLGILIMNMATTMLLGFLIGRNGWVYRIPESRLAPRDLRQPGAGRGRRAGGLIALG